MPSRYRVVAEDDVHDRDPRALVCHVGRHRDIGFRVAGGGRDPGEAQALGPDDLDVAAVMIELTALARHHDAKSASDTRVPLDAGDVRVARAEKSRQAIEAEPRVE